jgi:hypothetical protein
LDPFNPADLDRIDAACQKACSQKKREYAS